MKNLQTLFVLFLAFVVVGQCMATDKLKKYRKKREFTQTPEPYGKIKKIKGKHPIFVIHKHDASHLHYDLRLEVDGVLPSWAIPKGPSLDPKIKRLAIQTEDHPYEYAKFEGIIPEGEYGGGTVMIWDYGTYYNLKDKPMHQCIKEGRIEFFLEGKKLKGGFALVKTSGSYLKNKQGWLLIKMHDKYASAKKDPVKTENKSAKSKKTMQQIAHSGNEYADDDPEIVISGKKINIGNLDRVLFPKVKVTKGDLIEYYQAIAPKMLPLIKDHPLTLQRYPNGITKEGFYQKDASSYFPSWIKKVGVKRSDGATVHYVVASSESTIVYLANQAAITLHEWLSRADKMHNPDRMIFDLDPSDKDFGQVRHAALRIKEMLDEYKLISFVMTTGSRGLHVVVPLKRLYTYDEVADVADFFAEKMIQESPEKYTQEMRIAKRGKKIFIDTLRNRFTAIAVAPYSIRVKPNASVALPLSWKEVKSAALKPDGMTIKDIKKILKRKTEWEKFTKTANSLEKIMKEVNYRS